MAPAGGRIGRLLHGHGSAVNSMMPSKQDLEVAYLIGVFGGVLGRCRYHFLFRSNSGTTTCRFYTFQPFDAKGDPEATALEHYSPVEAKLEEA